jgi:putative membrane protein
MIEYDPHDWWSHFFDVKGSMVREILGRVLFFTGWAAVVVAFDKLVSPGLEIPPTLHTLVGFALGLLLVFRTNTCYDRFWEGRRVWGQITNTTRDLGRLARVHLRDDSELRDELLAWTAAFAFASKERLRRRNGLGPAAHLLPAEGVEEVLAADHTPVAISLRMTRVVNRAFRKGLFPEVVLLRFDQDIVNLLDQLGAAERIQNTPLPFAYMVHVRRALVLYCVALPFALVRDFGWGTIVDTLVVSYIFFGIEEIGVEIENPFGHDDNDLPLDAMCEAISGHLLGLTGSHQTVDGAPPTPGLRSPD